MDNCKNSLFVAKINWYIHNVIYAVSAHKHGIFIKLDKDCEKHVLVFERDLKSGTTLLTQQCLLGGIFGLKMKNWISTTIPCWKIRINDVDELLPFITFNLKQQQKYNVEKIKQLLKDFVELHCEFFNKIIKVTHIFILFHLYDDNFSVLFYILQCDDNSYLKHKQDAEFCFNKVFVQHFNEKEFTDPDEDGYLMLILLSIWAYDEFRTPLKELSPSPELLTFDEDVNEDKCDDNVNECVEHKYDVNDISSISSFKLGLYQIKNVNIINALRLCKKNKEWKQMKQMIAIKWKQYFKHFDLIEYVSDRETVIDEDQGN